MKNGHKLAAPSRLPLRLPWRAAIGSAAFAFAAITIAGPAQAYVGPGAGLTAIGTMVAIIAALILAIVGFVWYPLKRFLRKRNAPARNAPASDTPGANVPGPNVPGPRESPK